jgi:hypothetical protein
MPNTPLRLLLCTVLCVPAASAFSAADDWVAQIKVSQGTVTIQRKESKLPGELGRRLKENDIIITGHHSSVGMTFDDNSMLSIGANSEVVLQRYSYDPTTYLGAFDALVKRGTVSVTTGNIVTQSAEAMRVRTPDAEVQAARPSSFAISVEGR